MNILLTITISAIATIGSFFGVYNYLPLKYIQPEKQHNLGATITTIQGSDTLSSSRAVINTNFANLNADKIEATQTTLNSLTSATSLASLPALATVGTITSGTWNGTAVDVAHGGTASTTLSANQVLLGNGTSAIKTVSGFGTSGQFLTSGGAGTPPTWSTGAIDQAGTYNWTGAHTFNNTTTMATSTISSLNVTATTTTANISVTSTTTTANLAISGVCTGCLSRTTATSSMSVYNGGAPSVSSGTATCPAGYSVSGGGLGTGSFWAATGGLPTVSYPSSASAWSIVMYGQNGATIDPAALVYAVCIK